MAHFTVTFTGPTCEPVTKVITAKTEAQLNRLCYAELKGGLTGWKISK